MATFSSMLTSCMMVYTYSICYMYRNPPTHQRTMLAHTHEPNHSQIRIHTHTLSLTHTRIRTHSLTHTHAHTRLVWQQARNGTVGCIHIHTSILRKNQRSKKSLVLKKAPIDQRIMLAHTHEHKHTNTHMHIHFFTLTYTRTYTHTHTHDP